MTPFALAIRDEGFDLLRLQKNEMIQKTPHMQLHTVDLKLLVSCPDPLPVDTGLLIGDCRVSSIGRVLVGSLC